MAPPSPPSSAKQIDSQDEFIAHGMKGLHRYAESLNALFIIGIAINWQGFDDATRNQAQEDSAAAERREAGLAAADAVTFAPAVIDDHQRRARRLSGLPLEPAPAVEPAPAADAAEAADDAANADAAEGAPAAREFVRPPVNIVRSSLGLQVS